MSSSFVFSSFFMNSICSTVQWRQEKNKKIDYDTPFCPLSTYPQTLLHFAYPLLIVFACWSLLPLVSSSLQASHSRPRCWHPSPPGVVATLRLALATIDSLLLTLAVARVARATGCVFVAVMEIAAALAL